MNTYILVIKTETKEVERFLRVLPNLLELDYLGDTEANFVQSGILANENAIELFVETLENDAHASNFDPELRQQLLNALRSCEVAHGSDPREEPA